MTNPTSNFGWQMPTPTDLVTDLPADFEVFGQAVDTSMADLKGGTTGQILSKASNTNMDFTWITNDVGDITAVNVTAPITGGGTSGAVTIGVDAATTSAAGVVQLSDSTSTTSSVLASTPTATKSAYDLANAAIAKSTVTTAGDIIYRNATVPTRLGIGTANQVLAVNSGATAPEWVAPGGLTQISSTAMNNGTGTVSLTSIPSTYKNLRLVLRDLYPSTATYFGLQVNTDTGANYTFYGQNFGGVNVPDPVRQVNGTIVYLNYTNAKATDNNNTIVIDFNDYANTSTVKQIISNSNVYGDTVNAWTGSTLNTAYNSTSAISSIQIKTGAGTFSGGTAILYGVN